MRVALAAGTQLLGGARQSHNNQSFEGGIHRALRYTHEMANMHYIRLIVLIFSSVYVEAHMYLASPPCLRSVENPNYSWYARDIHDQVPDPLIEAPLKSDGSDFPAKLYIPDIYINGQNATVANWTAGTEITLYFGDLVHHYGGSCQFSLSNDNGKSFTVLKSIIGGCMHNPKAPQQRQREYKFQLPKETPAGDILFSWSWFNRKDEPKMFHNIAYVHVDSQSRLRDLRHLGPPMAVFNVFNKNHRRRQCMTVGEVKFPNPGNQVEYGGTWAGWDPSMPEPQYSVVNQASCPRSNIHGWSAFGDYTDMDLLTSQD